MKHAAYSEGIDELVKDVVAFTRAAGRPGTEPILELTNLAAVVRTLETLTGHIDARIQAVCSEMDRQERLAERRNKSRTRRMQAVSAVPGEPSDSEPFPV